MFLASCWCASLVSRVDEGFSMVVYLLLIKPGVLRACSLFLFWVVPSEKAIQGWRWITHCLIMIILFHMWYRLWQLNMLIIFPYWDFHTQSQAAWPIRALLLQGQTCLAAVWPRKHTKIYASDPNTCQEGTEPLCPARSPAQSLARLSLSLRRTSWGVRNVALCFHGSMTCKG